MRWRSIRLAILLICFAATVILSLPRKAQHTAATPVPLGEMTPEGVIRHFHGAFLQEGERDLRFHWAIDPRWPQPLDRDEEKALVDALTRIPRIRALEFYGRGLSDEAFGELSRWLPEVTNLELSYLTISPRASEWLCSWKEARSMSFSNCRFSPGAIEGLANLPLLESLTFQNCKGVTLKAAERGFERLSVLTVIGTKESPDLSLLDGCQNLERLSLERVAKSGWAQRCNGMKRLRFLSVVAAPTEVGDCKALAQLPVLETLILGWLGITDAGLAALSQAPRIETLAIAPSACSDASIPSLLAMPRLRRVSLAYTEVTVQGLQRMIDAGWPGTIYVGQWVRGDGKLPASSEKTKIEKQYPAVPWQFLQN